MHAVSRDANPAVTHTKVQTAAVVVHLVLEPLFAPEGDAEVLVEVGLDGADRDPPAVGALIEGFE